MEDRALMYALGELVTAVDGMRGTSHHLDVRWGPTDPPVCCPPPPEEMSGLLRALVLFQYHRQAEALQRSFHDALQAMEAALPEVWPEGPQGGQAPVSVPVARSRCSHLTTRLLLQLTGPNSTANSIMASFQQQQQQSPSAPPGEHPPPPRYASSL